MINNNLTIEQKINEIYDEVVNGDKTLDFLNVVSIVTGFYNLYLNRQQIDNNTIMKELNKQDTIYFEKIIKLLEEIKERYNDNK
jgi:hypothetical protein